MPLGDSITSGITTNGNPPAGQRVGYRRPLRDALVSSGYRIDYVGTIQEGGDPGFLPGDPQHEGHGGWSAGQLVDGHGNPDPGTGSGKLADWLNAGRPDVVLLHIGTNDLNAPGDNSGRWVDVERILNTIDAWESSNRPVTVIVSRIIDTNPPRAGAETTNYNDNVVAMVNRRKAAGDNIIWVDHQSIVNASGDYADTLHPNASGYQKMADVWLYPLAGLGTPTGNHTGSQILPRCP